MLALNLLSMVGWFLWFIFGGGIKGLEDSLGKPFRVDVSLVLILFGGVVPPFSVWNNGGGVHRFLYFSGILLDV